MPSAVTREEAARALWNDHYAPLAGWCAALVGDRDAAHDIASEAFARLLSRGSPCTTPRATSTSPPSNLVRDRWRREQRDRRLQARLEETHPRVHSGHATPGCATWSSGCPTGCAHPVLLHYYADMSVAEVAAALHKPEGTIKRMLYDARARLHGWLEEDR